MTTATMSKNGRLPRKSLADQINRLDEILDGLGQALNESVAAAVRQVVRETVEVSVREVLNNPELLRTALAQQGTPESDPPEVPPAPPPPKPPAQARPSVWGRLYAALGSVWTKASEQAQNAAGCLCLGWRWCLGKLAQGCSRATEFGRYLKNRMISAACSIGPLLDGLWNFRRTCGLAMGVGLVAGVGGFFASPTTAALICGLGGAVLTLACLILIPLGQLLFTSNASFA